MSQESRPDVTGILPGCHRISARIRREGWPDGAGILRYYNALHQIKLPRRPEYMSKEEHAKNFLVRLLSRMIFCWFLKEKGLIDRELLELENNNGIRYPVLKDINDANFLDSNSYYRGILQNIFFKSLNQEKKRGKKDFKWTRYLPDDFDYVNLPNTLFEGGLFDILKAEDNAEGI